MEHNLYSNIRSRRLILYKLLPEKKVVSFSLSIELSDASICSFNITVLPIIESTVTLYVVICCHHQVRVLINDAQLEYLTNRPFQSSVTILDKEGKKVKSFGDVEFYHPHGVCDKITMDVVSVGKEGTDFAIIIESLFLLLLDTFILLIGIINI